MILCGVMFYISDESSYLSGEDTLRGYVLYIGVMFSGERILCDIIRFSLASKSKLSGLCFNDMANLYTRFHMFSYRRCIQDEYKMNIQDLYTRFVYKIYTTNGHLLSNNGGTI